jgi:drug/metabolite transporter (DMT)-like permease
MNIWLIFAILAPLGYAVVNIIDKFLLEKKIKNFYSYAVFTGFLYIIPISIVWYFVGFPSVDQKTALIVFFVGICYGIIHFLYYYVLTKYEVSRIVALFYIYPVFVALFSFVFIGEKLSWTHYTAIVIAVLGTIFLGTEKHKETWRISHLFWIMLLASILPAIIDVSDKYLLSKYSYWEVYILVMIPTAVISILPVFSRNVRRDLYQPARSIFQILIIEITAFGAGYSFLRAASVAPISIVSALSTLQPVFVFAFTIFLSIFIPGILKESMTRHVLLHKAVGIGCIVAAAVMLSVA